MWTQAHGILVCCNVSYHNMPHLTHCGRAHTAHVTQVTEAAAAVYNKIVPSAEAKESEARQHLHRAGDAAEHAGQDLKTSAYELKEAVTDSARGYGRAAQDRCHSLAT